MFTVDEFDQPRDMLEELRENILGEYPLPKDALVIHLTPEQIELLELETYWNPIAMGAANVWYGTGIWGQGSLAVIIDTGVFTDHDMLGWDPDGPVIGGIGLSYDNTTLNPSADSDYEGFDNWRNHWHGTHVAGILACAAGILKTTAQRGRERPGCQPLATHMI